MNVSEQDGKISYRTGTPGRGSIFNFERISCESRDKNKFRIKNTIGNNKKNIRDGLLEGIFLSVTADGTLFFSCVSTDCQSELSIDFDVKIINETAVENYIENSISGRNCDNDEEINQNIEILHNYNGNIKTIPKIIENDSGEDSMRTFFEEGYVKISNVVNKVQIINCLR